METLLFELDIVFCRLSMLLGRSLRDLPRMFGFVARGFSGLGVGGAIANMATLKVAMRIG